MLSIDDFDKVDMRVGTIIDKEKSKMVARYFKHKLQLEKIKAINIRFYFLLNISTPKTLKAQEQIIFATSSEDLLKLELIQFIIMLELPATI